MDASVQFSIRSSATEDRESKFSFRADVLLNIGNARGRAGYLQLTPGIGEAPKMPGEFIDLVLQK